jgi:hypothetical protein
MFPTTIKCQQDFPAHSKPKLKTTSDSLKKEEKNNIKTSITEKKAFRGKQN